MLEVPPMTIDEIIANFAYLDDWEDKYRYIIELGRLLEPMTDDAHCEANRVRGCASQVWLQAFSARRGNEPVLTFRADSDAHIVKGLIYILLAIYSDRSAAAILAIDASAIFKRLGLIEHLTPQRANGVRAMIERIANEARAALAAA
jgi:cysteine desulfuration protein SufE